MIKPSACPTHQCRAWWLTRLIVAAVVLLMARPSSCLAQFRNDRTDILAVYVFNGSDESTFKARLEDQAKLLVERIAKVVSIEDSQKQKLTLAATGDLTRFYRELEIVREQTKGLNIQKQQDMQKAWEFVMPVRERIETGILNEGSLFEKVIGSVLTVEQRQQYDQYLREKEIAQYKAILHAAIADMEKVLPLASHQRTALIQLVESKPFPQKVARRNLPTVGYVFLGRLSTKETTAIFDDEQQAVFEKLKQRYAGHAGGISW